MKYVDDDLLLALYGGILEQPLWGNFLEQLRSRMGASYTTLTFRPFPNSAVIALHSGQGPPTELKQLVTEKYTQDPAFSSRKHDNHVYSLDALFDSVKAERVTFYKELLDKKQIDYVRFVQATDPGGVRVWLSCAGRQGAEPTVGALLLELIPHLQVALNTYLVLEQQRLGSAVTSEAIQRLNFGWLTLDEHCKIVDLTPDVEQVFQHSDILKRDRNDCLKIEPKINEKKIKDLVKNFAEDPTNRPRVLNLSRDPWTDMLIAPVQNRSLTSRTRPVAIMYLRCDHKSQEDRCSQLIELFGLWPSEAKMAWAIAQGMSIAEAAQYLGLTLETARHYSKKVYTKTGTRGQAELVRTILTSVMALN